MTRRKHGISARPLAAIAMGLGMLAMAVAGPAHAQSQKLTIALPGVPPIFGAVYAYVAQDAGLYKKYGLDVTLKPMNSVRNERNLSGDLVMLTRNLIPVSITKFVSRARVAAVESVAGTSS